ncbi:hypothetical protein TrVE_jg9767 [Triparma verrucosa]|uniref:Ankyrin n=1 Tax=Triparma verrucosa TaxID=1606542 RepID=A0A9W7KWY2_9STRA|nr:hypothetical protein TrVE_jg9767 [Triparma verrucosa]
MSTAAINPDGSLVHFPVPEPQSEATIAASNGDLETLTSYTHTDKLFTPDSSTSNTPLIFAASNGHTSIVDHLLSSSPSLSQINHQGYLGNTALSRASRGGHSTCVQSLLSHGADPNIGNDKLQYPLHFAAFKKNPEVVRILIDSGKCDLTVKDRKGRTPDQDTSVEEISAMIVASRLLKP